MEFVSNARPSLFAYPPPIKPPETKEVEKVATAVLSTTARAMARQKKHDKAKEDAMETDEKKEPETPSTEKKVGEEAEATTPAGAKKKKEPSFEVLENLSRVIPAQLKFVKFRDNSRYVPVKKQLSVGIVILNDKKPTEPTELMTLGGAKAAAAGSGGEFNIRYSICFQMSDSIVGDLFHRIKYPYCPNHKRDHYHRLISFVFFFLLFSGYTFWMMSLCSRFLLFFPWRCVGTSKDPMYSLLLSCLMKPILYLVVRKKNCCPLIVII
jgi:hypothetical protein